MLPNRFPERVSLFPLMLALHGVLLSSHPSTGILIAIFTFVNQIDEKSHLAIIFICIYWIASQMNVFLYVYGSFVFFPFVIFVHFTNGIVVFSLF